MELKDIIIGQGEYGVPAPAIEYIDGSCTYLRIQDITFDGYYAPNPKVAFNHLKYKNYEKYKLKKGDIVFVRTGNTGTGKNYLYNNKDGDLYYAGFLIKYSLDPSKVVPEFIGLYCKSTAYWNWIERVSSDGSTRKKMNAKDYLRMPIPNIPIDIQHRIVAKITPIEEKIKANRNMIHLFEEYSRLLFYKWFVDFNFPNEEGKPYKEYGGEMVEVDGKTIPNSWKFKTLKGFSQRVVCGKTPSTTDPLNFGDDVPFITIPDMHGKVFINKTVRCLSKKGADSQIKKNLPTGAICVSCIASPGIVIMTSMPSQTNQQINSIIVKDESYRYYLYLALKRFGKNIAKISGGSIAKNMNTTQFSNIKFVQPKPKQLECFNEQVEPLFIKMDSLYKENILLEETRDLLIKKLIK